MTAKGRNIYTLKISYPEHLNQIYQNLFPIEINKNEYHWLDAADSIYSKWQELLNELRLMPINFIPTDSTSDNIRRFLTENDNHLTLSYQFDEDDPSDESDYPIDIDEEVRNYFSQTLFDDYEEIYNYLFISYIEIVSKFVIKCCGRNKSR